MRRPITLALVLALSACAALSPEARVREKLLAAGVKPPMADCLAEKLARKLSIAQLRELGDAAKGTRPAPGHHLKADQVLARIASIRDPEVVSVATRAAIGCAIAG